MNIKKTYLLWSALLLGHVVLLGVLLVWNAAAQWRAARATASEYSAIDRADALAVQVGWLRDALRQGDGKTYLITNYFIPIQRDVLEIQRELEVAAKVDDGDSNAERELARSTSDHLEAAMRNVPDGVANQTPANAADAANELEKLHQSLMAGSQLLHGATRHHAVAASDNLRGRIIWICIVLSLALGLSVAIHYKQYRKLVKPLLWLRDEMQRSAANEFREPVRPSGDREFKELASFFNGLAKELAELYRGMEQKIILRSKELVRSERLASVGFLAAGVAHEINNPLSVISGYAELAAKSLRIVLTGGSKGDGNEAEAQVEAEELASALEAQSIIRDEAFRCKEITSRLLSLARGGGDGREALCMDVVARQVSILTKGLKNYRDRRVVLDFKETDSLEVVANPTEMKQVLLNLTVNALEAVPPDRGEVRIGGRRSGSWVELSIEDNGKGMSPETLEHVFEPFFTAKRGAGEPGTGLGLSITHTIVENHGGRLRAESAGPGRGSRFTVRLPATARKPAGVALAGAGFR